MSTTLEDKAGDPWQIIADLQRKLDARTAELQASIFWYSSASPRSAA
jgi:hypothetical protein